MYRSKSVPPSTPPSKKSRSKRAPSTVGAKGRPNACPKGDYIAEYDNTENKLQCKKNISDDIYFYESDFDRQYKNKNLGVFCCEPKIESTQVNKQNESFRRKFLLHKEKLNEILNEKIKTNLQKFNRNTTKQNLSRRLSLNNNTKSKKRKRDNNNKTKRRFTMSYLNPTKEFNEIEFNKDDFHHILIEQNDIINFDAMLNEQFGLEYVDWN